MGRNQGGVLEFLGVRPAPPPPPRPHLPFGGPQTFIKGEKRFSS